MWNAPYEGLLARSVLFRNNSVRDVCQMTSSRQAAPVWSATFASTATSSRHADLLIEGNSFDSGLYTRHSCGNNPCFFLEELYDFEIFFDFER